MIMFLSITASHDLDDSSYRVSSISVLKWK